MPFLKPYSPETGPDYDRQTLNTPNPIARYCHRRRHRIGLRLVDAIAAPGAKLLDFGCGVGAYLNELQSERPDLLLFGYDPYTTHSGNYTKVDDLADVPDGSLDFVVAFETLEHMFQPELDVFYREAQRMLSPTGQIVISVPIIGGPVLAIKQINRFFLFRRWDKDYTWTELAYCILTGRPGIRTGNVRGSHKGFDHRKVRAELRREFFETRTFFSPIGGPAIVNSQMFWVGRASKHRTL